MRSYAILYEKNAADRQRLQSELKGSYDELVTCYSLAMLDQKIKNFRKDKATNHQLIIISNEDDIPTNLSSWVEPIGSHSKKNLTSKNLDKYDLLIIGSSTGGFPVVKSLIDSLDLKHSSIILAQHISYQASLDMKKNLDEASKTKVSLVRSETKIEPAHIYLLSGGNDYQVTNRYNNLRITPKKDDFSSFHPSINQLISSLKDVPELKLAIMILSGLGDDGASSLKKLDNISYELIVQHPRSAAADGMPNSAIANVSNAVILEPEPLVSYARKRLI